VINKKTNREYFNCLDSVITNYKICTREIKPRIAMAKGALNRKKNLFANKLDFKEETSEELHVEHSTVWC
jgi:hypothetical protein